MPQSGTRYSITKLRRCRVRSGSLRQATGSRHPPRSIRKVYKRGQACGRRLIGAFDTITRQICAPTARSTSRPRLQPRQFPANHGDARAHEGLVNDDAQGKADQDRREGHHSRPLHRFSDGGGLSSGSPICGHIQMIAELRTPSLAVTA